MEQVKERIINKVLLISVVFLVIPYSLALIRSSEIGWQTITYFHTFIYAALIFVLLYKSKLSVSFKLHSFSVLTSVAGVLGLYYYGLAGAYFYCFLPILINVMLGFRKAAIAYLVSIAFAFSLIAVGNLKGIIAPKVDLNLYHTLPGGWLSTIPSIVYTIYILFAAGRQLFAYYAKSNADLIESEMRLANLIKKAPVAMTLTSETGDILDHNEYATALLGFKEADLKGKSVLYSYKTAKDRENILSLYKEDRVVKDYELEILNQKKENVDISISIIPFVDKGKEVLLSIFHDITERKKNDRELAAYRHSLELLVKERTEELESKNEELKVTNEKIFKKNDELKATMHHLHTTQAQLLQAEKMASLGILTAGVAHEINNPLNYIMGAYVGLRRHYQNNSFSENKEETGVLIDALKTGVDRSSAIVQGLNQFSRKTESHDEDCNVHAIIDNSLTMLHNQMKRRITIEKKYFGSDIVIKGNVGNLHQVFINIISNAVQSIESEGTITIQTGCKESEVIIEVTDTGKGISPEHMNKITDPFFTTKDPGEGTGLGLSITYNLISEHQGKLEFTSEQGKGTTVKIILPKKSYNEL